jgi:hypothetical protein
MSLMEILQGILIPLIVGYITYNERDKMNLKNKSMSVMQKDEIEKLIDLKLAVSQVQILSIKDDLDRIEDKIDKLIDRMNK